MTLLYQLLNQIRYFGVAFFKWISQIKISTQQQFANWKNTSIQHSEYPNRKGCSNNSNVELKKQSITKEKSLARVSTVTLEPTSDIVIFYKISKANVSHYIAGSKSFKTPRHRKHRLHNLLRRLSIRNFMDYCVIALNEASGSSSGSNKFDLSNYVFPIWLLGRKYDMPEESDSLIDDIRSRIWITYRKNFPQIDENTRYTTDRGFGCMIRCGQMVLANALICRSLGRDWRWSPKGMKTNPPIYTKILRLFQDNEDYPYSIHQIVRQGQHEGKNVGEWFGPNTIAQALKRMSANHLIANQIESELQISVDAALDNMVVIDEIKAKFKSNQPISLDESTLSGGDAQTRNSVDNHSNDQANSWIPGVLFIQLRLGLSKINPLYFTALKKTFQFENSLGIIGGRPNHALYLIGQTEDEIIYLDPHTTQQYIDFGDLQQDSDNGYQHSQPEISNTTLDANSQPSFIMDTPDSTYHCLYPEKMPLDRLDPSLALCFYFNTELQFDEWCTISQALLVESEQAPMFEITKSRPSNWNISVITRTMSKSSDHDGEEFEILT